MVMGAKASAAQSAPRIVAGIKKIAALTTHTDVQLVNWVEPDEYS